MSKTALKHKTVLKEKKADAKNLPAADDGRAPAVTEAATDHDQIARLAYSYWEARGRQGGSPEEDWFRAERDLRAAE